MAGQNVFDSRSQPLETAISPPNVARLAPKWVFTDHGDESATPAVADGVVYFPDFGGFLNAVNADTGKLIWQQKISAYDGGAAGGFARVTPAVFGNELILGDNFNVAQPAGAHVFAVSRADGHLLWSVQADSHPAAEITASPVIVGNTVIVGVSSNEEVDAQSASYPCCTFRGSVLALNAASGKILWKTFTVPPNAPCTGDNPPSGCGYSGGAVWGTPMVDPQAGAVYVGTGNNYTTPDAATACEAQASANHTSNASCTAPDDFFDSVMSLNLLTGQVNWGRKVEGFDAFNLACTTQPPGATWCPSAQSPDFDFGAGPNLLLVKGAGGQVRKLVGIGQKSGVYWALDPATGNVAWNTLVGPGSSLGGIEWGTAYDLSRIYAPIANPFGTPYTLAGGQASSGGSWAALDPRTGAFDWQVPAPGGADALGPASEAGGVVFAGDMAQSGSNMFALDASTGKILWGFPSGGSVAAGPAIVNGTVYWGSGYSRFGPGIGNGNDKFYAFSIDGR
jgi:polyvinyl alcohol dehydrogenase (cytochrome)